MASNKRTREEVKCTCSKNQVCHCAAADLDFVPDSEQDAPQPSNRKKPRHKAPLREHLEKRIQELEAEKASFESAADNWGRLVGSQECYHCRETCSYEEMITLPQCGHRKCFSCFIKCMSRCEEYTCIPALPCDYKSHLVPYSCDVHCNRYWLFPVGLFENFQQLQFPSEDVLKLLRPNYSLYRPTSAETKCACPDTYPQLFKDHRAKYIHRLCCPEMMVECPLSHSFGERQPELLCSGSFKNGASLAEYVTNRYEHMKTACTALSHCPHPKCKEKPAVECKIHPGCVELNRVSRPHFYLKDMSAHLLTHYQEDLAAWIAKQVKEASIVPVPNLATATEIKLSALPSYQAKPGSTVVRDFEQARAREWKEKNQHANHGARPVPSWMQYDQILGNNYHPRVDISFHDFFGYRGGESSATLILPSQYHQPTDAQQIRNLDELRGSHVEANVPEQPLPDALPVHLQMNNGNRAEVAPEEEEEVQIVRVGV